MHIRIVVILLIWSSLLFASTDLNVQLFDSVLQPDVNRVRSLILSGANVNFRTKEGESVLSHAAIQGWPEIITVLVESGANSQSKWEALARACNNGHLDAARLLINKGAAINRVDEDGWSPLMYAAQKGNAGIVELLLRAHAYVSRKNIERRTAIQIAALKGHFEIVRLILQFGGSKQDLKEFALLGAAERGDTELARLVLAGKVDVDFRGEFQRTPLMIAAGNRYLRIARILIEAGADVNIRDEDNATALMQAAAMSDEQMIQMLLNSGARINAKNHDGANSLIYAAEGYASPFTTKTVEVLLKAGIDTSVKNKDGKNAAKLFTEKSLTEIAKMIEKAN